MSKKEGEFVKWFSELSNKDIPIAGGKGASLAEMYNHKFPIPPGFVITAEAYRYFVEESGLLSNISRMLSELNIEDTALLDKTAKKVREMIVGISMPKEMEEAIIDAYDVLDVDKKKLEKAGPGALDILRNSHEPPFVAVRSSATTEDLVDASFAGQQESFLNVKGEKKLIESVKKCFASLFTARAIYYRQKKGFPHNKSYLAVVVQKMIDSEKSGVMFSKNPLKDDGNVVIEAVWGLGEGIVSGQISPDHYVVAQNLNVLEIKTCEKDIALVRNSSGDTTKINLSKEKSSAQVLTDYEIKRLAQYSLELERHYKKPQDIEFALANDEIYIVQSRPITTKTKKEEGEINGNVLFNGLPASPGVSSGPVRIINNLEELSKIKEGDVLVTEMTNPDMVVAMQKAAAIITNEGGITSHAAIVSREMGIPAVVGTKIATQKLKDGDVVTVDGFSGRIIEGKGEERKVEIKPIVPTKTKIKVIVDIPDYAKRAALSGSKSVGLVRMEGIIAVSGKHPVWYVKNDKIKEYVGSIYNGVKKIAEPFDEVWVRSSDVRSDEYRNLQGAPQEIESNPMLGDHGIRFSLKNQDILEAEFLAVKEVADDFPQKKFGIMMPQIISASEFREAKEIADKLSLPKNVVLGVMVETPAAALVIEDLCKEGISFISFGTNDLIQYTLAIDRNNESVQNLYTEMHPAVLNLIKHVIRTCKKHGVETSICGQAGSKPEMAKFLVQEGIDSISVNADAANLVSTIVSEIENKRSSSVSKVQENSSDNKHLHHNLENKHSHKSNQSVSQHSNVSMPSFQHSGKFASEEDMILQALDDDSVPLEEYLPTLEEDMERKEIPLLNDAISISSEDLNQKNESVSVFDASPKIFERQIDEALMQEVSSIMKQNEMEKLESEMFSGNKKGNVLDIF